MRFIRFLAVAFLALASNWATAQIDLNLARNLAATCANCHGTTGQAVGKDVKSLAGLPAANIASLMAAYKAGAIPNTTIMHQIAKGYTDDQIKLIAGYFADQKPAK
ncbi:MAG: cytochrome C [Betaproteobacteria bacterium]|nr:cytochrome C [Betaproteobacteria bacterium]